MRRPASLSLCLLILVLATTARAQGSLDTTITELQKQIQIRDAVDRDSKTRPDLKALNRRVLEAKRGELLEAVRLRFAQLQRYLATPGTSATPAERQYAETSLRNLISIRDGATGSPRPKQVSASTSASPVRPRSVSGQQTLPGSSLGSERSVADSQPTQRANVSITLEPVQEGESVVRGTSVSEVNEIVVEIGTREARGAVVQTAGTSLYSHPTQAKQQTGPVGYRVVHFSQGQAEDVWRFSVKLARPLNGDQQIRAIPNGDVGRATPWSEVGSTQQSFTAPTPVTRVTDPQDQTLAPSEERRYNQAITAATQPGQPDYPTEPPVNEQCPFPTRTRPYEIDLDWKTGSVSPSRVNHAGSYCFALANANTILYSYAYTVNVLEPPGTALGILASAIGAFPSILPGGPKGPTFASEGVRKCARLAQAIEDVKKSASDLQQALSAVQPGKADSKIASVSLETTLVAWRPIPAKFDNFEKSVDDLRKALPPHFDPTCDAIKDADNIILDQYPTARAAFLKLQARVNSQHVARYYADLDPNNGYDVIVKELYEGQQTVAASKTYHLGPGHNAITASAGFLLTQLPARTYSSVTAPNPANPSTTQNVLGVNYGQGTRVALTALLNYNLPFASQKEFGMALSVGPVYDISAGKADTSHFGLFGGVSMRLSKWMYVTPGVHIGEFADFPQGFTRTGQVIPAGNGTPVGVKRYTTRFAMAVTFKVKDLWSPASPSKNATPASQPNSK